MAHCGGFTLLELLIVLVIIGLLAALVGPQLLDRLEGSKVTTTQTQVRMLKTALDTLHLDIGRYPTTEEGLVLLTEPPPDPELRQRWHGPYLDGALPNDAWGHPYHYPILVPAIPPLPCIAMAIPPPAERQRGSVSTRPGDARTHGNPAF